MSTGTSWALVHRWASTAGLDVIACISPGYIENESRMRSGDPMGNVAQLLTFSDRMGYNVSWQLGYGKVAGNTVFRQRKNNEIGKQNVQCPKRLMFIPLGFYTKSAFTEISILISGKQ